MKRKKLYDYFNNLSEKEKDCVSMIESCLTYCTSYDKSNVFWSFRPSSTGKAYCDMYIDSLGIKKVEELFNKCAEIFKKHSTIDRGEDNSYMFNNGYYSVSYN